MSRAAILLAGALAIAFNAHAAAADCLVLGDSIAVGTAQHLVLEDGSRCLSSAKVGRPTIEVLRVAPTAIGARKVVISTGSNDAKPTSAPFALLRSRIYGSVTWLLPAKQAEARAIIWKIATDHGDGIIDLSLLPLADGIHPTTSGYRQIARILKGEMGHRQLTAAWSPFGLATPFLPRNYDEDDPKTRYLPNADAGIGWPQPGWSSSSPPPNFSTRSADLHPARLLILPSSKGLDVQETHPLWRDRYDLG